ncbi:uncharacterized protein BO80DRAFT_15637 [Aspergillus ibericus CBS 121593]|uniref:Uncharacterized protein n=1 Tax=Aspergillus ibericus CBS 121593 TaxID=1448316 RepID=A0A395H6F9_9EURO|nr:hypothetical protein BO80DRAFT_15637 [Aspergillus ibericus CBS 121593]RAL03230.1 hypothetical protein BO80DRAFT_15637 [Aspergillus ibericus CBS 121593]
MTSLSSLMMLLVRGHDWDTALFSSQYIVILRAGRWMPGRNMMNWMKPAACVNCCSATRPVTWQARDGFTPGGCQSPTAFLGWLHHSIASSGMLDDCSCQAAVRSNSSDLPDSIAAQHAASLGIMVGRTHLSADRSAATTKSSLASSVGRPINPRRRRHRSACFPDLLGIHEDFGPILP